MSRTPTDTDPAPHWAGLSTEARHPESMQLDRMSSAQIVALLLEEDRRGIEAAAAHAPTIACAADWVAEAVGGGGTVVFVGAGTSGRLGILEAAECPPTFGTDPRQIRGVIAGGEDAVFHAREGAEDNFEDGSDAVAGLGARDLVVAISASSVTPFARGALEGARSAGARTILISCADGDGLASVADLVLALATGPEILTGSTRLKAGSSTKAVLNAITTAAMVRLGKVFENLMVDLRPGSAKLHDRSRRILQSAAGIGREEAEKLYQAAGGELKTAVVMARCGIPATAARQRLAAAGGYVWRALEAES